LNAQKRKQQATQSSEGQPRKKVVFKLGSQLVGEVDLFSSTDDGNLVMDLNDLLKT